MVNRQMSSVPKNGVEPAAGVRAAVARTLLRLPDPAREHIWRMWWDLDRVRRRRLEARGDYSMSAPALDSMDEKLAQHLDVASPGFFVEAGANDGYHQSNTYRLERVFGWRGLLIEPVPSLFRTAQRERPSAALFNSALVSRDFQDSSVQLVYGGMMTTVAGARQSLADDRAWVAAAHAAVQEKPEHELRVPARTLSSLLDEVDAPEVDFLSLDVEGFEVQALQGIDFERHAPRWILVEIRDGGSLRDDVDAVLGDRYRTAAQLSPFDVLYRHTQA